MNNYLTIVVLISVPACWRQWSEVFTVPTVSLLAPPLCSKEGLSWGLGELTKQ